MKKAIIVFVLAVSFLTVNWTSKAVPNVNWTSRLLAVNWTS